MVKQGRYQLGDFSIVCRLGSEIPFGGEKVAPILDSSGREVAAVLEDADGNIFLPFDPAEAMNFLWSERYTTIGRAGKMRLLRKVMVQGYYVVRPLLPRPLQLRMRRTFAKHQNATDLPRLAS